MKPQTIYHRTVRWRSGSREIVIPKPLFPELQLGEYNYLNVWINKKWNIEISNGEKPFNNVNGTVLNRQVYLHGHSWAFSIPHEVVDTLESKTGKGLDEVEIFKNNSGNIEFKPVQKLNKKNVNRRNTDGRLKISYNVGTYRYVRYL